MMRRVAGLARNRRGAAAVEFAAVLTPLLLLIFGIFEFGRLIWTREALQETATAASRCMALSASSCASSGAYSSTATTTYIENAATAWGITLTGSNITLNANTSCAGVSAPNGFSTVTLAYTFQSIVPNIVHPLRSGISLSTTACYPNY
jgi:Flp pilus assembly protein TadG